MNGIEILSTAEVATATASNTTACAIAFWVCLAICIGLGIYFAITEYDVCWFFLSIVFGIVISLFITMLVGAITAYPTAYETRYKVTIDDSVSMNEFNEKYEVISQEGKIYTIRERKE